ncbi:MAG: fumarate hydratase [Spirochaetaceae bacterium]|jgi:fumarate hydratase class I|nr:fumarate hydratase [Spirochaetaceae bacterium]
MRFNKLIRARFDKTEYTVFEAAETAENPVFRDGRLFVPPSCLEALAEEAFGRVSFFYRRSHLELLNTARLKPDTMAREKLLIGDLIENAVTAAEGRLPLCQDTGTACVYAWKDEGVVTSADDGGFIERGIASAYWKRRLRASQLVPVSFFDEHNSGNNLPAQIKIEAAPPSDGRPCYRFLFVAKGGGSSNKSAYFSMTPAILSCDKFDLFLKQNIEALGTAACPPYRLAVVAGGSSPEHNLEVLKLATTELLDDAPYFGTQFRAGEVQDADVYRDIFWENRAMEIAEQSGLGAQVGGKRLALDVRVLRLPRHAASCPVSIGVSCAAHRNMLAFIDERGIFLEKLEQNPKEMPFLFSRSPSRPSCPEIFGANGAVNANKTRRVLIDAPLDKARDIIMDAVNIGSTGKESGAGSMLLSGKLLVARDAAHLAWHKLLENGKALPDYLYMYPVFYAGPSETPPGCVIGSIGPTTSSRMDVYAEELLSRGASLVSIGKGGRSAAWSNAASKYGGVYLSTAGGAAALIASQNIVSVKIIDYPELAMEAVRLLEVKDLRVFY